MNDKKQILENINTFCGNDATSAKDLLDLITATVQQDLEALKKTDLKKDGKEIAHMAHRLRFSFSIIGEKKLLADAVALQDNAKENKIGNELEQVFTDFLNDLEKLNATLK